MSPKPLSQLNKGMQAVIHEIVPCVAFGELDEAVGRRLADLGFLHGVHIELIAVGVFGKGPYAVRLGKQAQFSLRHSEAQKVVCLPLAAGETV